MEFLRKDDRYTLEFAKTPKKLKLYELELDLPILPSDKYIKNIELPTDKQKYTSEVIPKDISLWSAKKIEEFAKSQWHRRLNGEWQMIKGEPYYIPGVATIFFDWWVMMTGNKPEFRMEALELFQVHSLLVDRDPDVYGIFDLKCRRLGDTEKILCLAWERATRYFQQRVGMQSYDDTAAYKNFSRLVKANMSMPFFYKPVWKGQEVPQKVLSFNPPSQMLTRDRLKNQEIVDESGQKYLGSVIDYEATVTGKYDTDRLNFYYLDEVFKIKQFRLDVMKQLSNIKRCCSLHNEEIIVGNIYLSSTVEDTEEGGESETVQIAEQLWEESDPALRQHSKLNRTISGLVRIFRGYELAAQVDEWGMHKKKEAKIRRNQKLKELRDAKKYDEILSVERKEPATPEEALSTAGTKCILHPELCRERMRQITDGINRYGEIIPNYSLPYIDGELVWKNNIRFSEVEFYPMEGGKWQISQKPVIENAVTTLGGFIAPKNSGLYASGVDPYDADQIIGKGSDGAIAVKRKFFAAHETNLKYDDAGEIINVEDMITDQYVCVYNYRHPNPEDFYEDCLKTLWWYGTTTFPELDKPGFASWMRKNKMGNFLAYETPIMMSDSLRRKPRQGSKSTDSLISQYVTLLKIHISRRIWAEKLPRLIKNWQMFEREKRTKFDLSVASGFSELVSQDIVKQEEKNKSFDNTNNFKYFREY